MTTTEADDFARQLEQLGASGSLDDEIDEMLSAIVADEDLRLVIDAVDPSVDVARALYRASLHRSGDVRAHARWLLAGAYSLEGLDDVAHAVEPQQQATGLVKKSYSQ